MAKEETPEERKIREQKEFDMQVKIIKMDVRNGVARTTRHIPPGEDD